MKIWLPSFDPVFLFSKYQIVKIGLLVLSVLTSCKSSQMTYEGWLQVQVKEWKTISPEIIEIIQPFYDMNLEGVRYAEKVNTGLSFDALTLRNKIYFKNKLKERLLAHELEHVEQFKKNPLFIERYLSNSLKSMIRRGTKVSKIKTLHDNLEYEQQAKNKAKEVWQAIQLYRITGTAKTRNQERSR